MSKPKEKLIALIRADDIRKYSYRELSKKIGCEHPSQSRHYLTSLLDAGIVAKAGNGLYVVTKGVQANSLLSFPVMGQANCGAATIFADDTVQEVISVSPGTVRLRNPAKTFVVEAVGDSLNRANIRGKNIETGDYVFVEPKTWWDIENGDYVVSIIDGMANIKRLYIDTLNERIVLRSESGESFPPIIIDAGDLHLYHLSGKVIDVVKGVGLRSLE